MLSAKNILSNEYITNDNNKCICSKLVDLHQYSTKRLQLLIAQKRDDICKRFCWSARGINYMTTAPMFQDIDVECDITNAIECKQIIDKYYGKRKNANKYHIYYTNVFVDKLMLNLLIFELIADWKLISLIQTAHFHDWKDSTSGSCDKHTAKYIDSGKGYYEQDSYYQSVLIKPVDANELERLLPQFTTGCKCINYAEMQYYAHAIVEVLEMD